MAEELNIKDYCERCKYTNTKANESPCRECMESGFFGRNTMPIYFEKE